MKISKIKDIKSCICDDFQLKMYFDINCGIIDFGIYKSVVTKVRLPITSPIYENCQAIALSYNKILP